jgi:hypothetical protein
MRPTASLHACGFACRWYPSMAGILLIDDRPELLQRLKADVDGRLAGQQVDVKTWMPSLADKDPRGVFEEKAADRTLVVTDYDLTSGGQLGLFGSTIVSWCQQLAIPVADYSRANIGALPKEPDLFELRVPQAADAAGFIASVFLGFRTISEAVAAEKDLVHERSPAAVLSRVLGSAESEADFSLYTLRLGPASGALTSRVVDQKDKSPEAKQRVMAYITGHFLLNAVLRFPGPILSLRAMKAYVASDDAALPEILALFEGARYRGPFSDLDQFFWLSKVDQVLEGLIPEDLVTETNGEQHRIALERALNRTLSRHECPRCKGQNGGFYCPLTAKTVCLRSDCSVGSNSWIPQGARICRIERTFFDEMSPILGL